MDKQYWDQFYAGNFKIDIPSQFCALFCQEAQRDLPVVEFGCGNGRDSRVMASYGLQVLGIDASSSAIEFCQDHAYSKNSKNLTYRQGDVSALDENLIENFIDGRAFFIYSRFFQHSITEEEQAKMLASLGRLAKTQTTAFFEFRNEKDADSPKIYGNHYRRFQTADFFCKSLKQVGFEVMYCVSGQGMAKFKGEDPHVTRVIAHKNI